MKTTRLLTLLLALWTSWISRAEAPLKPHRFEKDITAFEVADQKNPPPKNAILFAGDSTFTRWANLHKDLPEYNVINRGFGGSQMSDLLYIH